MRKTSGSAVPRPDLDPDSGPYGILARVPDAIFFVKNARGEFERANQAFARLCGARFPRDLLGFTSREFFPSHLAAMYEGWDHDLRTSGMTMLSRLHETSDARGEQRWLFGTRTVREADQGSQPKIVNHCRIMPTFRNSHRIYSRLRTATDFLARFPPTTCTIADLAEMADCSTAQLTRDFGRILGVSPHAYRNEQRLQRARDLIRKGRPLADTALECGFADQSCLTRCFRKVLGVTPTEFAHAARVAPPEGSVGRQLDARIGLGGRNG
jgi:AraC-like DNA-binding protein